MEEVPDEIPESEPAQEYEELEETIPEPPPLKRANKLTEKVTCEGCGKTLSLHAYKYSHKCKARAPDEQPKEVKPKKSKEQEEAPPDPAQEARLAQLTEALKAPKKGAKPAMSNAQSQRPIRQKTVIQRTPEYIPPEPPYQPTQQDIYQHLIQQRQQQAYMRHQAMLAPYQNMFASRTR